MEKTTMPVCTEKGDKEGLYLEDSISELPDDVIVSILSLLTMKEAGRTSVLSKRWRGKLDFPFKDDQKRIELFAGGKFCEDLIHNFIGIPSYLCRLESLTLHLPFGWYYMWYDYDLARFPIFNKLKQLELIIGAQENKSLLVFVPLIEACPLLNKIVLKVSWVEWFARTVEQVVESQANRSLKEIEFVGFGGATKDMEMLNYLIKRSIMLEKITFDTRDPDSIGKPWENTQTDERKIARKRAYKLGEKLPVGA